MPEDEYLTTKFVEVRLNSIRLLTQLVLAVFLTTGLALRLDQASSWSYRLCFAVSFWAAVLVFLLFLVKF